MVHLQAVLGPVYYAVLAKSHDATLDPEPVSGYPESISGYPEAEPKATVSGPDLDHPVVVECVGRRDRRQRPT